MEYTVSKKNHEECKDRVIADTYPDMIFCKDPRTCPYKTPFSKKVTVGGKDVDITGTCNPY